VLAIVVVKTFGSLTAHSFIKFSDSMVQYRLPLLLLDTNFTISI